MIFRRTAQREFANAAAAVFVALFAILISTVLIRFLGMAAGGRIPADAVFALIGFGAIAQLPVVLTLTLFMAVLTTLNRMYRDSEMVVWFASGLSLAAWVRPVLRFALPLVGVIALTTLFLAPWAQMKSIEYREALSNRDDAARAAPGVFRESAGAARVFFVEEADSGSGRVKNVFVASEKEGQIALTVAAAGHLRTEPNGDRFVVLESGRRYDGAAGAADFRVMTFDRYAVRVDAQGVESKPLRARAQETRALLEDPRPNNLGELVSRIGMPVAALLLALLAIPLSFVNPRAGRTNSLLIALLVYLVYSNLLSVAQAWVGQGKLGFVAGMLLPHAGVVIALGLLFHRRLQGHARGWRRQA